MKTERDLAKRNPKSTKPTKSTKSARAETATGHQRDPGRPLLVVVAALCITGLVMVLSASSVDALHTFGRPWHYFTRQAISVGLGAALLFVTSRVDYHFWRKFAVPMVAGVALLLFLVLIPGVGQTAYGARRWLGAGPLQFQPSELAKLALIIFGADLLARHPPSREGPTAVYVVGGVATAICVLVMAQPDMGTTMVIGGTVISVLVLGGIPWNMLGMGLAGTVCLGSLVAVVEPYRLERLKSFADPWDSASGSGYQVVQSLVGLGSGGIRGLGLGASTAKWGFLPNAHTDFIFAIIGEELGLVGGIGVIGLFIALGAYGIRAASQAADPFGALVAGGITAWLVGQGALNIATVVGVLPVTGVPLPFVSVGGTSTMFGMAAAGIVINIARHGRGSR
ncbi:MAG: putative lipid II flippase FtsW [Acidimicrobiales bacterium]|nr:putative lipid II flippase FtsW [Acidimicrobiales bacterium]